MLSWPSLSRRGKQAVLTCKTRSASPRLGEELGVDTPRRLSSCTTKRSHPCERSRFESRLLFGMKNQRRLAHRFASANLACRVNAECELHSGLRRPLGTRNLSVAYSVNAAMRAADNCHPLPDQLHPCSSFPRFPRTSPCDAVRSREDRCVFTTPSIASAGGPVFTPENCSFPRAWFLCASLVSSPLSCCRLPALAWAVGL